MITPLEIQKKVFKKNFRGFDEAEVQNFLEEVAISMTELIRANKAFKDQIRAYELRISELQERESTVNETLKVVRRISEDMKENAKKESETIIQEARTKAKELYIKLQEKIKHMSGDIEVLQKKKREIQSSLILFLKHQISLVENQNFQQVENSQIKADSLKSEEQKEAPLFSQNEVIDEKIPIEFRLNRDMTPYDANSVTKEC